MEVFRDTDRRKAKKLRKKYKEYQAMALALEKNHFARVSGEVPKSAGSSKVHLELLGMLNAISRHANNVTKLVLKTGAENL
jgi:Na+/phosphate symporter